MATGIQQSHAGPRFYAPDNMHRPTVDQQWRQLSGRQGERQDVIIATAQGCGTRLIIPQKGQQRRRQRQTVPLDHQAYG